MLCSTLGLNLDSNGEVAHVVLRRVFSGIQETAGIQDDIDYGKAEAIKYYDNVVRCQHDHNERFAISLEEKEIDLSKGTVTTLAIHYEK